MVSGQEGTMGVDFVVGNDGQAVYGDKLWQNQLKKMGTRGNKDKEFRDWP